MFIAIILTLRPNEVHSLSTVNILIPKMEQSSGHNNEQPLLTELVEKIMQNFAKKFKLKLEYIFTNETLYEVLENEEYLKNLSKP